MICGKFVLASLVAASLVFAFPDDNTNGREKRAVGATWGYTHGQGADWLDLGYTDCDSGSTSAQSPINIVDEVFDTALDATVDPFTFTGPWNYPVEVGTIKNNGHTYQFSDYDETRLVAGGGLDGTYKVMQFHFHFGTASSKAGSEHKFHGYQYPAEMHIVTKSVSANITGQVGEFAALGFFIEISDTPNDGFLDTFLDHVGLIKPGGEEWENNTMLLSSIPNRDGQDHFFRYNGSLTTPECNPLVLWTLFELPLYLSAAQYDQFLGGLDDVNGTLENTFRGLMPMNQRRLTKSPGTGFFNPESHAAMILPSLTLLALTALIK